MYTQLALPDTTWPYVGGLCEGFVEGSWGQATAPFKDRQGNWTTSGVWPSATAAWEADFNGGNHPGELPPVGYAVPVYFALGSTTDGHVAIMLPDSRVLSSSQPGWHASGYIHPNLQDLIDAYARFNKSCTYLGWSEYVGKLHIIEKKEDEPVVDRDAVTYLFRGFLDRAPTEQEYKNFIGKAYPDVLHTIYVSNEYKERVKTLQKYYEAWKNPGEAKDKLDKIKEIVK